MPKTDEVRGDGSLPLDHVSLAFGVPSSPPGTVFALSLADSLVGAAKEGREIVFGRARPEVDVCVGEDDRHVSRRHGRLTRRDGRWWVDNIGKLPIRLPESRLLFPDEEPIPLSEGYTPLFLQGAASREHLLELFVVGADGGRPESRHRDVTQPPRVWRLNAEERLVLVVLGQRYLRHEANAQPLTRQQAANQLALLQPDKGWIPKRVENTVAGVRARLSRGGVPGLTREEVGEPVGNSLNHNLLRELLLSTSLVPTDLTLIDGLADAPEPTDDRLDT